jgi:SOS-response transcriptional repressor LexA
MTANILFDKDYDMNKIEELRGLIKDRLEAKAITQLSLAKLTGTDQASINRFVKKGEGLSAANFLALAKWAGWDFAQKSSPTMRRMGSNAPVEAVTGDDLVAIPIQEYVGAGNALDFFTAEPERFINILPRFNRKNMRAYVVDGDSMEPTIKKGAIIGVVPIDGPLEEGKIYLVCRPPFGLVVKEVFSKDGLIILRSANQKYPDDPVPYDGYDDIILGKVIWVLQEC